MSIHFSNFAVGIGRNSPTSTTNIKTSDMNNKRRKRIENIIGQFQDLQTELTLLAEEEQDAFDNSPESIQESDRGTDMQENIDELNDVCYELDNLADRLQELIDK